jgi:hypothetical protein
MHKILNLLEILNYCRLWREKRGLRMIWFDRKRNLKGMMETGCYVPYVGAAESHEIAVLLIFTPRTASAVSISTA